VCPVTSLRAVVEGTVIDRAPFGLFLDVGVVFPALLHRPLYPQAFDERVGGEVPPLGSTVRAVVVSHVSKQLEVSALPEHLADPHRFEAHLFALLSADDGHRFIWFPGFTKRDWQAGDLIPWGPGYALRVVRMIDPEREDQLPVLIVESADEHAPDISCAGPLDRLPR
jgi:hypothetical protein